VEVGLKDHDVGEQVEAGFAHTQSSSSFAPEGDAGVATTSPPPQ
jgi:hypothetical protein